MATRIEQKYPVYIETAILNVEKAKEVFPITSNINSYSTVSQRDGRYFSTDLMYSLRKNRSEIPMAFYRNGIMSERSLENFLENNKLYVKPGEYRLRGETLYHGYDSFANYSTDMDGRTSLDVADPLISSYLNARINFLTSYVYKRENGRLGLISSPKDQGSIDDPVTTDKYIGYDFADSSALTNLIVNNYIQKEEDSVLKFKASAPDASDVWLNGNFHLLCEYLGEAKATANQVFKTKYFPISAAGTVDSNFSDNLTHIGVVSANGSSWDFYQIFESYQAALADSSNEYSCYFDRYTGRIYFSRQGLNLPEDVEYIVGNGTIVNNVVGQTIDIPGKDWNYLEDDGAIQISLDGISFETVKFHKATQNKIQITTTGDDYSGDIRIYPLDYFAYPSGKVYAFYTTVMGFEKEVNSSVRKLTEKEIEPWLWVGQKTIAVLAKDKVFPAKITLRALDMPLARRSGNSLVYGPLYYGAEIAILEGEVLSYNDEPIVNQEVTISIKQGPGMLNGSKTINVITNDDGKFYINYYPQENSFTFLRFKDTDITYQGTKTFLRANSSYNDLDLISLGSSGAESCIIYAILKDDGSLGTTGKRHAINAAQYSDYSIYESLGVITELPDRLLNLMSSSGIVFTNFLRDDEVSGYRNGQVTIFDPSLGEYVSLKIKDIVKAPEYWWDGTWDIPNEEAKQSTYVILLQPEESDIYSTITSFDTIWLKKETDVHYDSTLLNGRKCILSELKSPPRTNWKHPNVEGYPSVYGPIMTTFYNGSQNKFTVESVLPISSSTDPMIDIAGYALIPEKSVLIQAETTNEDDIIYSNNVEFEIKLNNRDKGVVENILGTFKVPYGFRLVGNGDDSSSTISTATFLTINKVSGAMPNTTSSTKYPLISRLGVNGIIYLDSANEETVYQPSSSSVKFTISAD